MNEFIIEEVNECDSFTLNESLKGIAVKEKGSDKIQVILCEAIKSKKEEIYETIIDKFSKREFFIFEGFECIVIN